MTPSGLLMGSCYVASKICTTDLMITVGHQVKCATCQTHFRCGKSEQLLMSDQYPVRIQPARGCSCVTMVRLPSVLAAVHTCCISVQLLKPTFSMLINLNYMQFSGPTIFVLI